jgi:hypothetical protein
MLKIQRFFNTFWEHVADYYISQRRLIFSRNRFVNILILFKNPVEFRTTHDKRGVGKSTVTGMRKSWSEPGFRVLWFNKCFKTQLQLPLAVTPAGGGQSYDQLL